MSRKLLSGGWIAGALVVTTLAAITLASFSGTGVQVEAGGVQITLKASLET